MGRGAAASARGVGRGSGVSRRRGRKARSVPRGGGQETSFRRSRPGVHQPGRVQAPRSNPINAPDAPKRAAPARTVMVKKLNSGMVGSSLAISCCKPDTTRLVLVPMSVQVPPSTVANDSGMSSFLAGTLHLVGGGWIGGG